MPGTGTALSGVLHLHAWGYYRLYRALYDASQIHVMAYFPEQRACPVTHRTHDINIGCMKV